MGWAGGERPRKRSSSRSGDLTGSRSDTKSCKRAGQANTYGVLLRGKGPQEKRAFARDSENKSCACLSAAPLRCRPRSRPPQPRGAPAAPGSVPAQPRSPLWAAAGRSAAPAPAPPPWLRWAGPGRGTAAAPPPAPAPLPACAVAGLGPGPEPARSLPATQRSGRTEGRVTQNTFTI